MSRVALCLTLLSLFTCGTGLAQDLDQLRVRIDEYWIARVAGNQLSALDYVLPADRERFLQGQSDQILRADITGLEFTGDNTAVNVPTRLHLQIPGLGEIEVTSADRWIWTEGDWFYRMDDVGAGPFGVATSGASQSESSGGEESLEFEFLASSLEVGPITQGETVEGFVEFSGDPRRIRTVLTSTRSLPKGLRFGRPVWIDETRGRMSYSWDTLLTSSDVRRPISFTIRRGGLETAATLEFIGHVDGRIRFSQIPEVVDLGVDGELEIVIENLAAEPFRIPRVTGRNEEYEVEFQGPEILAPGDVAQVIVRFQAHDRRRRTSVDIEVDPEIFGRERLNIPIEYLRESPSDSLRQEDFERLLRDIGQPVSR